MFYYIRIRCSYSYYYMLDDIRKEKEAEQRQNLRKVAAPAPPWSRHFKQKSKVKR